MSKNSSRLSLVFFLCLSILMGLVANAQAQESISTPTPIPTVTQTPIGVGSDSNLLIFEQLQLEEIQMVGPYDSYIFDFAMPADWKLTSGTRLNLLMGVSFNTNIQARYDYPVILNGGTLSVYLNGVLLSVLPLNDVGEIERQVPIPLEAFANDVEDDRMVVSFVLDSSDYCYTNDQFNMVIHTSSYFILPHESTPPDTSLINFPRPIYQNSFDIDSAILVVPEQPSAAELQAALIVSAALGNFSQNSIVLDMATLNSLTPAQASTNHLIFVGKASSLPALGEMQLPQPIRGGQFQIADGSPDDGLVQMINSPWNKAHVLLAVSGNTDSGVIKAAQAISTGVLRSNRFPNLAIVKDVQTTPVSTSQPTTQTLTDLGYQGDVFYGRGVSATNYNFYIPQGWNVAPDAYFELVYSHSALIDFNRSTIVVRFNDRPIGSVRMDANSADQTTNRIKIDIPAASVVSGNNRLQVRAELQLFDDCAPPSSQGLWLRIWPESVLHLPLEQASVDQESETDLTAFPAPFIYDPTLNSTAFVLAQTDLDSWRNAVRIAAYLGSQAKGSLTTLSVFYSNDFPETERSKYHIFMVGRPSQISMLEEINSILPVPFFDGSDITAEDNFQVTYQIPPDSPLGYVELLPSPWKTDKVILTALGNTTQGINWATASLVDPIYYGQLAGNYAEISDKQVLTTDTRVVATNVTSVSTAAPVVPSVPIVSPSEGQELPIMPRPAWVLPALIVTIVLILLFLIGVVIKNLLSKRNGYRSD